MRFATISGTGTAVVVVRAERMLSLRRGSAPLPTMREIAGSGLDGLRQLAAWADAQPATAWEPLDHARLGPAVPDPGAIYTIGHNYRGPGNAGDAIPRPLVYGKARSSVDGGAVLRWDRSLTPNVDAEVELGVVIGEPAWEVAPDAAMRHVFGFTIVNDVSSRDPWLDGDQWLLGKSMPGFCPVGPWVVTADELDPSDLRLGCMIGDVAIQDGSTSDMRFSIAEVIAYLSRHVRLETGDLIATGTPARLHGALGPGRHLEVGDVVTAWIEGIGKLTTRVA
jgi:2-keto-4-pentenoate hydratase/2-oxohepta-3-ene-1,7-dioic acid hydratase in catechol pathway